MPQYLTSGQIAKQLRVSISTLKRWLDDYQLEISDSRNSNGWRLFSSQDLERLKEFKRTLRKKGKRFNNKTLVPVITDDTKQFTN